MIEISITADGDYSAPLFVSKGKKVLGISIHSPGTQWTGTIELQRLPGEGSAPYPLHSDTFITYLSKTADYEDSLADLASGWYRLKATAAITNIADCKIW